MDGVGDGSAHDATPLRSQSSTSPLVQPAARRLPPRCHASVQGRPAPGERPRQAGRSASGEEGPAWRRGASGSGTLSTQSEPSPNAAASRPSPEARSAGAGRHLRSHTRPWACESSRASCIGDSGAAAAAPEVRARLPRVFSFSAAADGTRQSWIAPAPAAASPSRLCGCAEECVPTARKSSLGEEA
jgi:hypothetical protein